MFSFYAYGHPPKLNIVKALKNVKSRGPYPFFCKPTWKILYIFFILYKYQGIVLFQI